MDPSNTEMVTQNGKQVPAKYPVFYTYAEYESGDVWAGQADDQRDQTLEFQGKSYRFQFTVRSTYDRGAPG
jgi:hypothetical protein